MGLLKTAVKVGVASSVHGRVQRRQQRRWAAQDQQAAPQPAPTTSAPPPDTTSAKLDQLRQLGELRDAGVLTETEFDAKKALILGS